MTNEAPAGWYPAPEEPGSVRYWTGTQWSPETRVASAETFEPAPKKKRPSRRVPLWVAITAGAVGLFLGVGAGANSAETNRDSVKALESELTDALDEVESTETALQTAEDTLADTEADLEAAQADFKAKKKGLVLEAKEATKSAEAAEARAIAAEASNPEPAPIPAVEESIPEAESPPVYYQNCTAARNGGGAPVYAGGPGYGPHLDRDGDGVGCE